MKRVIMIEGLFSNQLKNYLWPMLDLEGGPSFVTSWMSTSRITSDPRYKDIIIGHSLGGAAAIQLANRIGCESIITLDPRKAGLWSLNPCRAYGTLALDPSKAKQAFNFNHADYEGWFPGLVPQKMHHAVLSDETHMSLPYAPRVISHARMLLAL